MTKILNIFYAKIVIAPALDDTQNFLKESLISTYLTSTSLLFIERHDQFFVLNRLRLQKMKTDVKKKKIPKCPGGCQSLPQKLGFSIPLQPRKIKSLILRFGQPPFPVSSLLCTPEEKQTLNIQKLLLF